VHGRKRETGHGVDGTLSTALMVPELQMVQCAGRLQEMRVGFLASASLSVRGGAGGVKSF
jgi:hypothetical protein